MGIPRLGPWIAGAPLETENAEVLSLASPLDGSAVGEVVVANDAVINAAVENAHAAYEARKNATVATRLAWLRAAAEALADLEEPIVHSLVQTIGKPRRAATFEAKRSSQFIGACANELPTINGEVLPLDAAEIGAGRFGFARRVPYGVVAAITPFNAPANLLLQKAAPAIAMGNSVVVKPAPVGTEVALLIASAFKRAGLPDGLFNVVPGGREAALSLAAHRRVAVLTITGSTQAGHDLARAAGAKPVLAELGSNAANIVCADADLADAAQRIASAAFDASGQQCISAQRIIVEASIYDRFLELLVAAARKLKVGAPDDPATDVGPMVTRAAADRVIALVEDAVAKGAQLALEPTRDGALLGPAIVAEAPPQSRLLHEEAFGPVVVVQRVADLEGALALANASEFGLQGACFTQSLETAFRVSRDLRVGSLWINEASRFRLDSYPFGGVGESGYGREGVRYAMEELSQWKFTGIRLNTK